MVTAAAQVSRPIAVMHLLPMLRTGGMELGVVKLANHHDRCVVAGSICSFMTPVDGTPARLASDVPLFELGRTRGNDPVTVAKLVQVLRRTRPDVVHSHSWGTLVEGYVAARIAGVPVIVHGEHGTCEEKRRNAVVQRFVWNRVNQVVSVSSELSAKMSAKLGFPTAWIRTIPNGLDTSLYALGRRAEARRALGIEPDAMVIGTVGRLVEVKAQHIALHALARLKASGLDARFVLVGGGPLRSALEELASTLGVSDRVMLCGERSDVPMVLEAFDIFVLTSHSEGLSNTIQEAMASALPVVATRVGGSIELIRDGEDGLLVPPSDPEALAASLSSLLLDLSLRLRIGTSARRSVLERFSLERMVGDYERLYSELVKEPSTVARPVME